MTTHQHPSTTITEPANAAAGPDTDHDPEHQRRIQTALDRRSFAVLSTASAAGNPHAAGVLYDNVGLTLYVNTFRGSRKARNVADTGRAAVVVPVRRLPIGPPFAVQFQATGRLLAMDDPTIVGLIERGDLGTTTKHGALDEPDGCFIEITPTGRVHTYGLGVPVLAVARDPLHAGARSVVISRR